MFRVALHSTVETHALYSAGGGALQRLSPGTLQHQVGTLQHPTHPVLLQHCVGLFPSTLQHWVGTLQHPKARSTLTALRGYFTAPIILRVLHSTLLCTLSDKLQHHGHQVHSNS